MGATWKRQRQTVVVDLGRGSIKLAAAEAAGEAVRFHGITRLPLSAAESERGEVDPAELASRIGAEVERRGWRGMPAAGLLSGSTTSTQSFLFPSMPMGELRDALALKLAETLHFELDQASFSFRPIRELEVGCRKQVLVLAAAARRETTERAASVLQEAGLRPVALGLAAESLANLAHYARLCREDEASIHVDVGSFSTILNLFEGRWLRFSREIDCAGETFTRALMRPILGARGALRLTREQAEEVKLACGHPREDEDLELPHGVRSPEVLPLVEPVGQRLAGEIRRSIDYLCGILERLEVNRIVLSGPGGQLRNLDAVLQESLDVPVVFTDPVARAKAHWRLAICDEDPPPLAGFSAILGYSLGNHRPIDLLPRERAARRMARRLTRVRAGLAPGALGLGVTMAAAAVPIRTNYGTAAEAMQRTIERLDERLRGEAELAAASERLRQEVEALLAARGPAPDWPGLLKELAAILPREARLTSLSLERSGDVLSAHLQASLNESGASFDALVGQLTGALAGSPFFRDVRLLQAERTSSGSGGRLEVSLGIVAARSAWGASP
jgi:type IV pilus assembly protein PilM